MSSTVFISPTAVKLLNYFLCLLSSGTLFHGEDDIYHLFLAEQLVLLYIKILIYLIGGCCCQAAKLDVDKTHYTHTFLLTLIKYLLAFLPQHIFFCIIAWRLLLIGFVLHKCVTLQHPWYLSMSAASPPPLIMPFINNH